MPRLLFLDDLRMPTDCISYMHHRTPGYKIYSEEWVIVRNYSDFIFWIRENGLPDLISFDHDLGEEDEGHPSGMECAKWLVNYCMDNQVKLPGWMVHSWKTHPTPSPPALRSPTDLPPTPRAQTTVRHSLSPFNGIDGFLRKSPTPAPFSTHENLQTIALQTVNKLTK